MSEHAVIRGLTPENLRRVLEVTRDLAAPYDLNTLLYTAVDAAKDLLDAEGATVWQYLAESNELEMRVARGLKPIRIPADRGIAGECVRTGAIVNVPDCYADPRFNRDIDRDTGARTRCLLSLPLIGSDDGLVGVLQVVNRRDGAFDADDEELAAAFAAQCAVALQRSQMIERILAAEKLRQEIAVAREIQVGTLPKTAPAIEGYDLAGTFRPADETGGDTYDFVRTADGDLMVLMGDATGHGIGPALSATQTRAMLRVAQRLGAGLDECFRHINDQLVVDLPEDRFVTAFLGCLDPQRHVLRFHSGGQGPLLHWRAADGACQTHAPTTFPLGAMPMAALREARSVELAPGDVFAVISDGVFEYHDRDDREFGEAAVIDVLRAHAGEPMAVVIDCLLQAVARFGDGAPQRDDITIVLIRRLGAAPAGAEASRVGLARSFASLPDMFSFIDAALAGSGADADARYAIGFAFEELFTNMVKYNPGGGGQIGLEIVLDGALAVCSLADPDSDRFDVTAAPDVDIHAPVESRRPGGLGLHLIRRLVDCVEYDYSGRCSRITFRRKLESA